jgi:hypothetical protein
MICGFPGRPAILKANRAPVRETNVLDSSGEAVNNWAATSNNPEL